MERSSCNSRIGCVAPVEAQAHFHDFFSLLFSRIFPWRLPLVFRWLAGMKILLKQEGEGLPIAVLEVTEKYIPNKPLETLKCYGTSQLEHPGE